MSLYVSSQFGCLSRGRHSARRGSGQQVEWARRDHRGWLVIDEPGTWQLHATDGFSRVARATLRVEPDGTWSLHGSRFSVHEA